MAIIRIRRSTGTTAPSSLKTAELAYAMGSPGTQANGGDRLYFGKGDDGSGNATTIEVIGGGYFTGLLDHVHGTLTANSAIIVDGDSKIDQLNVDNITIDGNTISSTDTNGNIVLDPNGSGVINVSGALIQNVPTPTEDSDAANKKYVDDLNTSQELVLSADSGDGSVNVSSETLFLVGGTGLNTEVSGGTFTIQSEPITIGSTSIDLGGTSTSLAGLTQLDVDNVRIDGNTISSTDVSNELYLDPAPTNDDGGDLIIRGNLIVQGTTTTVNSTELSVNDKNIVLADSAADASAADGGGITLNGANATILYDAATDRWDLNKGLEFADSIGGTETIFFSGTKITEAIEDHLVNNVILAGEGLDITYDDNANTITFSGEDATLTNKGIASFGGWADSDETICQFSVTNGDVRIEHIDGGTF